MELADFLSALGLIGGGKNTCEKIIAAGYFTLDAILQLKKEDLIQIDGLAEKSAHDFLLSLESKKNTIAQINVVYDT